MIDKVKDIISKRGLDSISLTGKVFRQFDSYNGKNKLNIFFGLRECGIILQKKDKQVILGFFDKDNRITF